MIPKDKAIALYHRYYTTLLPNVRMRKQIAIHHALIAVDEILQDGMLEKAPFMANGKDLMKSNFVRYKDYWEQVKTEIKNL